MQRRAGRRFLPRDRTEAGRTRCPSNLVADLVDDGPPEIRLEGARATRVEAREVLERVDHGLLRQVVGVEQAPRHASQPAPGPSTQARQVALAEPLDGVSISAAGTLEKPRR